MLITPSFKKSLIVEQFQGNYLKAMVAGPPRKFSEFLNATRHDQSYKGVELRSRPDDLERLAEKRRHLAASIEEYSTGQM